MRQNQIQDDITLNDTFDGLSQNQDLGHPSSIAARLQARLLAPKFDRLVDADAVPTPGSPLAVHIARLTSVRERETVARAFRRVLEDGQGGHLADHRIPVLTARVDECREAIDEITLRLHSPRPVAAKGVARLRMLLSDGTGPMYFEGQGNLAGQIRSALAAL